MPDLKINLSHHTDKFASNSQELIILKKVNFIFGKNGTGKTTIADEISNQLSADYDVRVFKDFDGVVENDRLNAVALGMTNAIIQLKIDAIDVEIKDIRKQIEQPEDKNIENLFTKVNKKQEEYYEQNTKIETFFTRSASQIKNESDPHIASPTYNKNNFQGDIANADLLSNDEIIICKNTIKADKKDDISKISFPEIDLSAYLKLTNEILQSSVAHPQDMPELKDNVDKQNFARQGMEIHEHVAGEICAFCGNKISNERWQLLGNYFNDEVKKLENHIDGEIAQIKIAFDQVTDDIEKIKENSFYDKFAQDIKSLNLQIEVKQNEYKEFLKSLQTALEDKRKNLFVKSPQMTIAIPQNFDDIKSGCDTLVEDHNKLSKNLETEQEKAKNALRWHKVKENLDSFKYYDENSKLAALEAINRDAQNALRDKTNELQTKQEEYNALILQTKDERQIAEKINKILSSMGVVSFSLQLVEDDDENQKGQYQIKGHDGNVRPVTKLSKGEKNIIAFLYFILNLESVDGTNKPRIIVLDDPMTSNDDTMQYLMIGEIQKYYRRLQKGSYFILLTHNCHFYLNVRENTSTVTYNKDGDKSTFYDKYGIYHLFSDGKRATIKSITDGKNDFKTSYETLWKELVFLYKAEDATPDLMLSPCRKICETYTKFIRKDSDVFYGDNMSARKLFNVSQHGVDDFEAEINGKTKEEIKDILNNLFKENNAEEHFNNHWKGGQS